MAANWIEIVKDSLLRQQAVCRVVIAQAKGSTPRESGAEMFVTAGMFWQTIGGGQLEFEALAIARSLLFKAGKTGFHRHWQSFALGPNLGQCCGGHVHLLFEAFDMAASPSVQSLAQEKAGSYFHPHDQHIICQPQSDLARIPIYDPIQKTLILPAGRPVHPFYLYGAGHVGRALIEVTGDLALTRFWVDVDKDRFPAQTPGDVSLVPARDMAIIARNAPDNAFHIVMSYSHKIDEDIVHAILSKGAFAQLGLIGSATKRQRFYRSLQKAGIDETHLTRLVCPIGLQQITGKSPAHVALSIAAQLAIWIETAEL